MSIFSIDCMDCGVVVAYSDDYRGSHDLKTLYCLDCKGRISEDEE